MRQVVQGFIAVGCLAAASASACGGSTSEPASADASAADGAVNNSGSGSSSGISSGSSGGGSSSGTGSSSGVGPTDGSAAPADGSSGTGSGSSSGAGNQLDAAFDVTPPPSGQAGFAFVVNGVVLTPVACPAYNWEFPAPAAFQQYEGGPGDPIAVCDQMSPPCPGVSSALIINTGQVPLAYTAEPDWNLGGGGYPPGVQFGDPMELSGVLSPGQRIDITSVWIGNITAVLGASEPFSSMSHYVSDEGTIPWPAGVSGGNGATTMYVAEINLVNACHMPTIVW